MKQGHIITEMYRDFHQERQLQRSGELEDCVYQKWPDELGYSESLLMAFILFNEPA